MANNPYLRQLRTKSSLSQQELGGLLAVSQEQVSKYEQGIENVPLPIALALQVIFGEPPRRCFSAMYALVEENVMERAATLERVVRDKVDPASERKQALLKSMMARATNAPSA